MLMGIEEFKQGTATVKFLGLVNGGGQGNNIVRVTEALRTYHDHFHPPSAPQALKEGLLYNVWKECLKWLKVKEDELAKADETGKIGDSLRRRRNTVQILRDQAVKDLAQISPTLEKALQHHQTRKTAPIGRTKSLDKGYTIERAVYEGGGKRSGFSVAASYIETRVNKPNPTEKGGKVFQQLSPIGFQNLTLDDARKLERYYLKEPGWQVAYLNKIARLQYLAVVTNGLLCDINQVPLLMNQTYSARTPQGGYDATKKVYAPTAYAMDKYGNLFLAIKQNDVETISYNPETGYSIVTPKYFNHSTYLAGREVVCAGNLHVGYDVRSQAPKPGVLSCIDNCSGHYKPTADNLRTCLTVLRNEGVDVDRVRVRDFSSGNCYWGGDFLNHVLTAWKSYTEAPQGGLTAPPVLEDAMA